LKKNGTRKENQNKNHTFERLKNLIQNKEFLENIYGIGEKIIIWLQDFRKNNEELLIKLHSLWLNFSAQKYNKKTNVEGEWSNKHFCITGTFPIARPDIIKTLESKGATFDNSPNKKTDFMLIGEKAGSKAQKAKDLNIKIYNQRTEITKIRQELSTINPNKTKKGKQWPITQSLF